jgi:error-prone DNA polymerase
MISQADTVGVFQIESRAQMSMLPRLRPRTYYDLVIEVAIVRPGPIQGKMVHPYLRRRNGEEAVVFPTPEIAQVLRKTLGVPLFQEQAIRLAVVAAGFTPGEADQLRRAMAAWGRSGRIETFRQKLVEGMLARGLTEEFAERVFEQIRGFGGYGFPESHAASFALLVYVSAWLKRYYPAAFAGSIINSQPMGFYAPAQLVSDARQHGVEVRPVDVNASAYDCTLEARPPAGESGRGLALSPRETPSQRWGCHGPALRLGMRLVKGLSRESVAGIERARADGAFRSVTTLWRRSGASRSVLARLAAADAFRSMGLNRRQALWQVLAIDEDLPLFVGTGDDEPQPPLPDLSLDRQVVQDYDTVGLSLAAHPIELVRRELVRSSVVTAASLNTTRQGQAVRVAGLVLVRQRPSTAAGIVFFTLEDETGVANLIVRPAIYERFRRTARGAVALIADGRIERQGNVIHVQVHRLADLSKHLGQLRKLSRDFH